uniref:Putative secreted protein n=1 Tax=Anopheles darlingi TaxID=43151 RepID=A0A2M4DJC9_ANODA
MFCIYGLVWKARENLLLLPLLRADTVLLLPTLGSVYRTRSLSSSRSHGMAWAAGSACRVCLPARGIASLFPIFSVLCV